MLQNLRCVLTAWSKVSLETNITQQMQKTRSPVSKTGISFISINEANLSPVATICLIALLHWQFTPLSQYTTTSTPPATRQHWKKLNFDLNHQVSWPLIYYKKTQTLPENISQTQIVLMVLYSWLLSTAHLWLFLQAWLPAFGSRIPWPFIMIWSIWELGLSISPCPADLFPKH